MKTYSIILYCCFCVCLSFSNCNSNSDNTSSTQKKQNIDSTDFQENDSIIFISKAQFKNGDLVLGSISKQNINNVIQLNGRIEIKHSNHFKLTLPFGGRLKSIFITEGITLKKGDTIGIVENPEFINIENEYLKTKENLVLLEIELKNKKTLFNEKAISEKEFLKSQTEFNIAKINLKSSAEKLSLLGIEPNQFTVDKITKAIPLVSPCNCALLKLPATLEDFYTPNDVIVELRRDTVKHLHLKAFEKYVDQLRIGQSVIAYTNYSPNKKYQAFIKTLNFSFDESKAVEVHCNFLQSYDDIIPGLYMTADVVVDKSSSYSLPQSAIVNYRGKNYIFIQDLNNPIHFDMKAVELGLQDKEWVEIKNYQELLNKKVLISGAYETLMQLKNSSSTEEE